MNSDTFKDRLLTSLGDSSKRAFAKKCAISDGAMHSYLQGKTTPDLETLQRIAEVSECSLAWLASGEGPMRRGKGPERGTNNTLAAFVGMGQGEGAKYPLGDDLQGAGYVHVPRYDIAASAGGGAVVHSEQVVDYLAFRPEWVQDSLRVDPRNLALIRVVGDSMEPTMFPDDLVLVDTSQRALAANAIYVLQFMGELLVKRIQSHLDGTVSIISDNTLYAPETVRGENLNSLNVVGRVVWYGRRA